MWWCAVRLKLLTVRWKKVQILASDGSIIAISCEQKVEGGGIEYAARKD